MGEAILATGWKTYARLLYICVEKISRILWSAAHDDGGSPNSWRLKTVKTVIMVMAEVFSYYGGLSTYDLVFRFGVGGFSKDF